MMERNRCCEVTSAEQDRLATLAYDAAQASVVYRAAKVNVQRLMSDLMRDKVPPTGVVVSFLNMTRHKLWTAMQTHGQLARLNVKERVYVFGDLHGQHPDLLRWMKKLKMSSTTSSQYVFLGDYVDRGNDDVQTMLTLLCFKTLHPSRVVLLRGNHECFLQNSHYGFKDSCKHHFGSDGNNIWKLFNELFECLPRSALINGKIFCMHGGLSPEFFKPEFTSLNLLRGLKEDRGTGKTGVLVDLFWADPAHRRKNWTKNKRGISWEFNSLVVDQFHDKFGTTMILRAHQMVDGYEVFCPGLATVFSAPNYVGGKNRGAVVHIKKNLQMHAVFL